MENYNVKIYPIAKKDLLKIVEYINELSPEAALNQYDSLTGGIISLKNLPKSCPFLKNDNLKRRGYRFFIIDNYLVLFIIKDNEVQIRRIIYSKRKYDFLIH